MSRFARIVGAVFLAVWCPRAVAAANVTLEWDPATDGITTGYVVAYGTASQVYTQQVDVGGATTYTVGGLVPGSTYYFAVRAYDALGDMSDPSNEVQTTITIPPPPPITALSLTANLSPPQLVGTTLTWTAGVVGGVAPYQFQWSVASAGAWTVGQWVAASTWTWTPAVAASDYLVRVAVRSAGSTSVTGELTQTVPFPITGTVSAGRVNVAAQANGATAVGSSIYGSGFPASGAINGEHRGLNWAAGGVWADGTPDAWPDSLEITFSGAKTIDEIDLFSVQDAFTTPVEPTASMSFSRYGVTGFSLEYWDGARWIAVPGAAVSGNRLVWRQVRFTPVTTSKVRLSVTGALDPYTTIAEVEVYGVDVLRSNVAGAANGGTAVGSSTYGSGFPASGAINGEHRGLNWAAGGVWADGTPDAWPDSLEITFSGAKTIDEIDVFSVQDAFTTPVEPTASMSFSRYGVTAFSLEYWDGARWIAVPGAAVSGNRLVWRQVRFTPVTTSKVRLSVTGALDPYTTIAEVEVYGVDVLRSNVAGAANGGTAVGSSIYGSGFPASGAINGEHRGLNWAAGGVWADGTPDAWPDSLEITFSGAKTIDEIDLFSVQDAFTTPVEPTASMSFSRYGVTGFSLEYWDGARWIAVPGAAVSGNRLVWRQVRFTPVTTSKVRLSVTGALDPYTTIAEVEVYGVAVGNFP